MLERNKLSRAWIGIALVLVLFVTACSKDEQTTVNVFAAASLKDAMEEIIEHYEAEHPKVKIQLNTDSSGTLQKQIQEGAPADIFFSAGENQMNTLIDDDLMDRDSKVDYLENHIVLIKPQGMESKVEGFDTMDRAEHIALATEDTPAGEYARELLKNIGKYDAVFQKEINEAPNVTAVLMAVREGGSDVGIVYETDAKHMAGVDIIERASTDIVETPTYPVALSTKATDHPTAVDFFEFLTTSKEVRAIFLSKGFDIIYDKS